MYFIFLDLASNIAHLWTTSLSVIFLDLASNIAHLWTTSLSIITLQLFTLGGILSLFRGTVDWHVPAGSHNTTISVYILSSLHVDLELLPFYRQNVMSCVCASSPCLRASMLKFDREDAFTLWVILYCFYMQASLQRNTNKVTGVWLNFWPGWKLCFSTSSYPVWLATCDKVVGGGYAVRGHRGLSHVSSEHSADVLFQGVLLGHPISLIGGIFLLSFQFVFEALLFWGWGCLVILLWFHFWCFCVQTCLL